MAINFPNSPVNGQTFSSGAGGPTYRYDSTLGVWNIDKTGGSGNVFVSDTKPSNPFPGMRWYRSTDMREFIYYADPDGAQWIETSQSDSQRPANDGNSYVMKDGVWIKAPEQVIISGTVTNATYAPITLPTNDFMYFDIEYDTFRSVTGTAYAWLQTRVAGVWQTANYTWVGKYSTTSSDATWSSITNGGTQGSYYLLPGQLTTTNWSVGKIRLHPGAAGVGATIVAEGNLNAAFQATVGYQLTTGRVDGIRFACSTGDILNINYRVVGKRG